MQWKWREEGSLKNKRGFILADTLIALFLCSSTLMLVSGLKQSELRLKSQNEIRDDRGMQQKLQIASERREYPACTPLPQSNTEDGEAS